MKERWLTNDRHHSWVDWNVHIVPGVKRDAVPTRHRYRIPDGTLMEQYGKAASGGSTQPLCSITGHKFGLLVANLP